MVDLCEKCGHRAVCRFREHYEECLQFIDEVIRCKDCKFSCQPEIYDPMECNKWATKWGVVYTEPNGFCHKGERREGE